MATSGRLLLCALIVSLCAVTAVTYGRTMFLTPDARAAETVLSDVDQSIEQNAGLMVDRGRDTFRYDTFGDEAFWTGALKLERALEGSALGGIGTGVSPKTALAVGLKVDMDKLPADLVSAIKAGKVDLNSPETTLALLKL